MIINNVLEEYVCDQVVFVVLPLHKYPVDDVTFYNMVTVIVEPSAFPSGKIVLPSTSFPLRCSNAHQHVFYVSSL